MLYQFTPNTKIQSAQENANWSNFSNHGRNFTIKWTFSGTLLVTTLNDIVSLPDNATINRVDLIANVGPIGAAVIADVQRSQDGGNTWTTIFTNSADRPQIADGAKTGNTTTIDVASITKLTDYFRPLISQVGSSTPGSDMALLLRGQYNLD